MDIKDIKHYLLPTLGIEIAANESTIPGTPFFIQEYKYHYMIELPSPSRI